MMKRIVVDTDVASYIFNWHSLAQRYADVLRGSDLVLSFMTIAELRIGAMAGEVHVHYSAQPTTASASWSRVTG